MGLDMFIAECREGPDNSYTLRDFLYWRKSYPIMTWFDEKYRGVGNCVRYRLNRQDLTDLAEWCEWTYKQGHFLQFNEYEYVGWVDDDLFDEYADEYLNELKDTAEAIRKYFSEGHDEGVSYWVFHGWW